MLPRENQLCGCARPNATQGSVPAGLALACDFAFRFQCQMGSSLVLHRPIETTAVTGQVDFRLETVGPRGTEYFVTYYCTVRQLMRFSVFSIASAIFARSASELDTAKSPHSVPSSNAQ